MFQCRRTPSLSIHIIIIYTKTYTSLWLFGNRSLTIHYIESMLLLMMCALNGNGYGQRMFDMVHHHHVNYCVMKDYRNLWNKYWSEANHIVVTYPYWSTLICENDLAINVRLQIFFNVFFVRFAGCQRQMDNRHVLTQLISSTIRTGDTINIIGKFLSFSFFRNIE